MKASVIICTFNHLQYLKQTLPALTRQSLPALRYQIIVVNDGSTDGTFKYLEAFAPKISNLTLVNNKKNHGLAAARNMGSAVAKGELLIFLDDDNVPDFTLVEEYLNFAKSERQAFYQGNQRFPDWILKNPFARVWASWTIPGNKSVDLNNIPFKNICPGNFAIVKKHFDAVRGFNEQFRFWGLEDGEFAFRVTKQLGLKLVFVPKAVTVHIDESFTFAAYSKKYLSIGRNALPLLWKVCPEFTNTTGYVYLKPLVTIDTLQMKLSKVFLKIIFRSPIPFLVEKMLILSDKFVSSRVPAALYKMSLAYSTQKGLRKSGGREDQKQWF